MQHEGRICPLIAGSVGPYGACLSDGSEYTGNYLNDTPIEALFEIGEREGGIKRYL